MDDLVAFFREFMLQVQRDAAVALAATPPDQDAGVIVTPVLVLEGEGIEMEPMAFYRPAEVPGG
ncbi:hypothetical protein [Streptomyces sp. NPDC055055]